MIDLTDTLIYQVNKVDRLTEKHTDSLERHTDSLERHTDSLERHKHSVCHTHARTYTHIHINTTQPAKEEAAERFCNNFSLLPEGVKARLVVEVDDKRSQFTSVDLYEMVHKKIGIPITFDYLHNNFM